ncbi:MAG: cadherin-like domain-containing protein, partial [Planctomycetaceae bacterium]|nr:cadherin-like domain-containing protein [Planctomycetaceae bacterium]
GYQHVAENAANGTPIGTLVGSDVDVSNVLTYSLLDDAGGRFAIHSATGAIVVANGSLLDFETNTSHQVVARVTDTAGAVADLTVTIVVDNVNEAPVFAGVTYHTDYITTIRYAAPGLLDGVWDAEGDVLTAQLTQAPHSGALLVSSDGSFIFWPEVHFVGTTEFTIEIFDGQLITPVVYRVEIVRPTILPPNFGIPADSGPPLHVLDPEERAERDPKNVEGEQSTIEESKSSIVANTLDSDQPLVSIEDQNVATSNTDPPTSVRSLPSDERVAGMNQVSQESTEKLANFSWMTEWQQIRQGRYELERSQIGRLPELSSYEGDLFELGRLGSQLAGSWEMESFALPKSSSANPEWAPMISSHLELTVSLGATAAWLAFHGRMLAAAAAANALREAIDPTRLLEQAAEMNSSID